MKEQLLAIKKPMQGEEIVAYWKEHIFFRLSRLPPISRPRRRDGMLSKA
jgi:hypothetical protein